MSMKEKKEGGKCMRQLSTPGCGSVVVCWARGVGDSLSDDVCVLWLGWGSNEKGGVGYEDVGL